MKKEFSIIIVEDDKVFSSRLKEFFEMKMVKVLDQSIDVSSILAAENQGKVPDVILLDINLAGGENGIEAIPKLKRKFTSDIVILSSHDDSKNVFRALCNGAVGYLKKGANLSTIYDDLLDVVNGGSCMTPSIARKVVHHFQVNEVENKNNAFDSLTPRELQIVEGIKDGLSYKLIADRLSISIETVRFHVKNIYRKLHVNSKTEVLNAYFQYNS